MHLSQIAEMVEGRLHGEDVIIERLGNLDSNNENAIVYVENEKKLKECLNGNPAALLVPRGIQPAAIPSVEVEDPKMAFIVLLRIFSPSRERRGIKDAHIDAQASLGEQVVVMPGAVIMAGASLGDNCIVYPNCVIEEDVIVGRNTILYSGVVVRERCIIGSDCILHAGTVVGADGYGFYEKDGDIIKIPQIGNVVIGDRVEIGANCCIDRATVDSTRIGSDTKFDNMVHVAHNVRIGEKCYIVAQVGISGSVTVGNRVVIAGQVGIADHVSIADGTVIMGQSGITSDVRKPDILFGTPARPVKEHHRIQAALKYLPQLLKRVKKIERKLEEGGFGSQDGDN
jgi:UDP-3-O-[3-hydroxymyristoyl] glucosamine N-acyltransferase